MVAAKYTAQQKKDLVETINRLEKQEQEDIFSIFKRHGIKFSHNVNGIFINMKEVKVACFKEVEAFLVSAKEQRERMARLQDEVNTLGSGSVVDAPQQDQDTTQSSSYAPAATPPVVEDTALLKEDWTVQEKVVEAPLVQAFVKSITGQGVKKATTQQNKFFLLKKKYGKPFLSQESKKQEDMGIGGLEKEAFLV